MNNDGRSGIMTARRLWLGGRVQGVGFRPFVYRLAGELGIAGWVRNRAGRVEIHAEAAGDAVARFARELIARAPPLAQPALLDDLPADCEDRRGFEIRASEADAAPHIHVPPDYYACDDCLRELADPRDRRHRYPFINCTQCGPRYTLITRLPYDRPNTTMAGFALCPDCEHEYRNPGDRRFHAEPVACPACGPRLRFAAARGTCIDDSESALQATVAALRAGRIVAVKGVGGYHLMCDAANDAAVARLRAAKPRPHKPLAVMFPRRGADGLDAVRAAVAPGPAEAALLIDPMRPIVLCAKREPETLSAGIAPSLSEIGAMLPYSPLHQLLLDDFGAPLVATSANVSGEPVLTDEHDITARLAPVAEAALHHDRPIERPADDAVYRVIAGRPRPLRLGRGSAPLELDLPFRLAAPLLAVGGHMKNTVALAWEDRVVVSPHIGDLGSKRSQLVFEQVIADLQALYQVEARSVVHDAHPGYASSRYASRCGLPALAVLHHHAHASALAGEFPAVDAWLVFAWDGVGLGDDGSLWGGEALAGRAGAWQRAGRLRPFFLPGGEKAGREPWRSAAALCWQTGTDWPGAPADAAPAREAWRRRLNCPQTSAAGRLFDAAAALLGLVSHASFEGQGPMQLEAASRGTGAGPRLPVARDGNGLWEIDWAPLLPYLLIDNLPRGERAHGFHASLADALLDQAVKIRHERGVTAVGLSGGVFQNRLLSELAATRLRAEGFAVYLGERIPANDAGLSYGQIIEAAARR